VVTKKLGNNEGDFEKGLRLESDSSHAKASYKRNSNNRVDTSIELT
jgi:hypothetical protein